MGGGEEGGPGRPRHMASSMQGVQLAADMAMLSGWWFKPEYIINELNINAAITSPAHDEVVALRPQPYTVRGYAYTGESRHWSVLLGYLGYFWRAHCW